MERDRSITLYPGAAPTEPCPYGPPFPDIPSNFLLAAPTASGKTQIIMNIILKYYRGMFARVWIFCPTTRLDPQYKPLIEYLEKMTDQKKEPLIFEEFDPVKVGHILDEQRAIVEACVLGVALALALAWLDRKVQYGTMHRCQHAVVSCMEEVAFLLLAVAPSMLHATWLHAACCMLHAACCMMHPARKANGSTWRAEGTSPISHVASRLLCAGPAEHSLRWSCRTCQ